MSDRSNSTALSRIFAEAPTYGYALAMGKDTFTDVGDRLFRACLSDPDISPDVTGELYDEIRSYAVSVGLAKHKPMKDQTAKSRASQVSKLANFPLLAQFAQANDSVTTAYEYIRESDPKLGLGVSGYTKVLACLTALKATLVKDPQADADTLKAAAKAALVPEVELASDAVAAFADKWGTLVHGNAKTGEHPFQAQFALLATSDPRLAESIQTNLDAIVATFRAIEAEQARKVARAKGGLSV